MHKIIYKNLLRNGKNVHDFQNWLSRYWNDQQSWGAREVTYWTAKEGHTQLLFSEYVVDHPAHWIREARKAEATPMIRSLEKICHCNKITIKPVKSN